MPISKEMIRKVKNDIKISEYVVLSNSSDKLERFRRGQAFADDGVFVGIVVAKTSYFFVVENCLSLCRESICYVDLITKPGIIMDKCSKCEALGYANVVKLATKGLSA